MDTNEIINLVQCCLINGDNPQSKLSSEIAQSSGIMQYKLSTAYRLVSTYCKYKSGKASKYDFECCLRNYLLVFHTEIQIDTYSIVADNPFGLAQNGNIIYANYDLPHYVNNIFVKTAFMSNVSDKKKKKYYDTPTNPYIRELTGFDCFKSVEQQIAVHGALNVPGGYTALIAMLTGGGKSLVTQSIAYQYDNSLTIVVVPTVSLMLDQERNAKSIINTSNVGNEIFSYYNNCDDSIIVKAIESKKARLIFISPEALIKNKHIKTAIQKANMSGYLKNLVIDEAHIVVEWGSSFRIDFQCLDSLKKNLIESNSELRTYLLSATYSDDTVRQLKLFYSIDDKWIEFRLDKLRKEPRFNVIKAKSYTEKHHKLFELINLLPRPIIVYVKSPDDAEKLKDELCEVGYKNVNIFTGRTDNKERETLIREWANNDFDIMIATCAFGVGVDKRDVRTVLHLYIPENPNKYYQECGRGGRDGLPCLSVLLYTEDDVNSAFNLTQKVLTTEKLEGRWFSMFESFKTKRIAGTNSFIIDTSVTPSYRAEEFYLEVSDANIGWNIYVLLLLRRSGLIAIEQIDFNNDLYVFTISVLDTTILHKGESATTLLEKVRNEEWQITQKEFIMMKNALKHSDHDCLSEMFTEIYSKTDEYCAGCNAHDDVIDYESIKLSIKNITEPQSKVSEKITKYMGLDKEMLIFANQNDIEQVIEIFISIGVNLIVLPNEYKLHNIKGKDNSTVFIITQKEFRDLCSFNNTFFISGSILFYIETGSEFTYMYESMGRKEANCIYLSKEDLFIDGRHKNMSEIINGLCKHSYIVNEELSNL